MKTTALTTAITAFAALLPEGVSVHEDGGLILVTAPDRAALVSAYTVVRTAIEATGRTVKGERCGGKLTWRPERSQAIRAGMRVALTADEELRHLQGC